MDPTAATAAEVKRYAQVAKGKRMNRQYQNRDFDTPPAPFVLQYGIDPTLVYVSTATQTISVDLTITVFNPTSAAVDCESFQFGIYVGGAQADLAATDAGVKLTSDQTQWNTTAQPVAQGNLYWYTAQPANGAANESLAPSASWVFHLNNLVVNDLEGTTQFAVLEVTAADPDGVQGSFPLTKEPSSVLLVPGSFTVIPPEPVSPGTEINLTWEVGAAAEYWLLYNSTLTKLLYDSRTGSPPEQSSWQDTPKENTTYEVIVYQGQMFTDATALAQVSNPRSVDPTPSANPQTVDSGAASTISWATADAAYVIVTAENYTSGHIDSSSGTGSLAVDPISQTLYTLTPYNESGLEGSGATVQVYVNSPAIVSFTASPQPFASGQPVTLAWQTTSATSATLDPGGIPVPPNSTGYQVYPQQMTTYTLTAAGQGTASRELTVVKLAGTYGMSIDAWALVSDGTYLWGSQVYTQYVARQLLSDGGGQQTFPVGKGGLGLVYDGTYVWVTAAIRQ